MTYILHRCNFVPSLVQFQCVGRQGIYGEFVRTVYGADQIDEEVDYRKHEAHIVGLLFRWNWEYLRVQDGIYPVEALPVEGFRWQYRTIGIRSHWEEKKNWLDPGFVSFMETEIIPFAGDT